MRDRVGSVRERTGEVRPRAGRRLIYFGKAVVSNVPEEGVGVCRRDPMRAISVAGNGFEPTARHRAVPSLPSW